MSKFIKISLLTIVIFILYFPIRGHAEDEYSCSGTIIDNKGHILTAAHCYAPRMFAIIAGKAVQLRLVDINVYNDLMLLQGDFPVTHHLTTGFQHPGMVISTGFTHGEYPLTMSIGKIEVESRYRPDVYYHSDGWACEGMSGGAMIQNGILVGVLSAGVRGDCGASTFYVKDIIVQQFLFKNLIDTSNGDGDLKAIVLLDVFK